MEGAFGVGWLFGHELTLFRFHPDIDAGPYRLTRVGPHSAFEANLSQPRTGQRQADHQGGQQASGKHPGPLRQWNSGAKHWTQTQHGSAPLGLGWLHSISHRQAHVVFVSYYRRLWKVEKQIKKQKAKIKKAHFDFSFLLFDFSSPLRVSLSEESRTPLASSPYSYNAALRLGTRGRRQLSGNLLLLPLPDLRL